MVGLHALNATAADEVERARLELFCWQSDTGTSDTMPRYSEQLWRTRQWVEAYCFGYWGSLFPSSSCWPCSGVDRHVAARSGGKKEASFGCTLGLFFFVREKFARALNGHVRQLNITPPCQRTFRDGVVWYGRLSGNTSFPTGLLVVGARNSASCRRGDCFSPNKRRKDSRRRTPAASCVVRPRFRSPQKL